MNSLSDIQSNLSQSNQLVVEELPSSSLGRGAGSKLVIKSILMRRLNAPSPFTLLVPTKLNVLHENMGRFQPSKFRTGIGGIGAGTVSLGGGLGSSGTSGGSGGGLRGALRPTGPL